MLCGGRSLHSLRGDKTPNKVAGTAVYVRASPTCMRARCAKPIVAVFRRRASCCLR